MMKQLDRLANSLPLEERDEWIKKVTRMTSRMENDDEMRIILEAVGLVAETVDKRLSEATEEMRKATGTFEAEDCEKLAIAVVDKVTFPDFGDLRSYLKQLLELRDKEEEIAKLLSQTLNKAERIHADLKDLNGKSFFFWSLFIAAIVAGVLTGILSTFLVQTHLVG